MKSVSRCLFRGWQMNAISHRCMSSAPDSKDSENKHWRKTFEEQGEWSSNLKLFASDRTGEGWLMRLIRTPIDLRPIAIQRWFSRKKEEKEIYEQQFIQDRHRILGSDLATAHFILYRGGKVKFLNIDKWYEGKEHGLPDRFTPDYCLEAVNASNTNLHYEGLTNFVNLKYFKSFSLRNCVNVNDWVLDYISGELQTLEYLDLYDCKNITEKGLACLYRMRKLKYLNVGNISRSKHFQMTCLLLEDSIPGLSVEGCEIY